MDEQLYRVRQLKKMVQILDGFDGNVATECIKLLKSIDDIKLLLDERKNIFEKNKQTLNEQKLLIDRLNLFQDRLNYMETNFPEGVIKFVDENNFDSFSKEEVKQGGTSETKYKITEVTKIVYSSPSPTKADKTIPPPTPKPRSDVQISISYVSNSEFQEIPDYMRGRLKAADVNNFIDIYNNTLTNKYEILKKPKNSIKGKNELDKFVKWKSQITPDNKGLYFCTADDICIDNGRKFGKKEYSFIVILRHVKRIKEIRNKKCTFYVACF